MAYALLLTYQHPIHPDGHHSCRSTIAPTNAATYIPTCTQHVMHQEHHAQLGCTLFTIAQVITSTLLKLAPYH